MRHGLGREVAMVRKVVGEVVTKWSGSGQESGLGRWKGLGRLEGVAREFDFRGDRGKSLSPTDENAFDSLIFEDRWKVSMDSERRLIMSCICHITGEKNSRRQKALF